jgi:hypothetical protein
MINFQRDAGSMVYRIAGVELDEYYRTIKDRTMAKMTKTPITPMMICWVRIERCCPRVRTFFFAINCSLQDSVSGSAYYKTLCKKNAE